MLILKLFTTWRCGIDRSGVHHLWPQFPPLDFTFMFYVSTLSLFVIKSALKLINAAQAITMSGNYTFYVHFNTCNSHIPTSLTNEVKLSVTISHITHYNTCSALYRIGQYVYFSKLIADKCWFLNYLLSGGVVLVDHGLTIYDLSFHR
jgi:hypothetical protein